MSSFTVKEKPDNVSWEDIKGVLYMAHENNRKHGLIVNSTRLTADQLKRQVGDGQCYVAFDGNKLIGVAAVKIKFSNCWFCHGNVAHFLLGSVLSDYQGMGVYSALQNKRLEYVSEHSINIITTHTAANNTKMLRILPRQGFHRAMMFRVPQLDHYSIIWVKWMSDRPCRFLIKTEYLKSVVTTKLRFAIKKLLH